MCAGTGGFLPVFNSKQEFEALFHAFEGLIHDIFEGLLKIYCEIIYCRNESNDLVG